MCVCVWFFKIVLLSSIYLNLFNFFFNVYVYFCSTRKRKKQPTYCCCWSCLKSCPITFDSQTFKVSRSSPCFHICLYTRAPPQGDCFHSFSSMSCSPPCTPEERAWIPTLIPTTTTRFLFIKKSGGSQTQMGGQGAPSSPAVLTHL